MQVELEGTVEDGVVRLDIDPPLPNGLKVKVLVEREDAPQSLGDRLRKFKGIAQGLPADLANNHDHYLHGAPKR
jgi:hypothetical protein